MYRYVVIIINFGWECPIIVNISLALMKKFSLFPVARGIVAIIHGQHILYTHRQRSNKYTLIKKIQENTYNGQEKLISNSRQTVAC